MTNKDFRSETAEITIFRDEINQNAHMILQQYVTGQSSLSTTFAAWPLSRQIPLQYVVMSAMRSGE